MKTFIEILNEQSKNKVEFVDNDDMELEVDGEYTHTLKSGKTRNIRIIDIGKDYFKYSTDRFNREVMIVNITSYNKNYKGRLEKL